MAVTDDLRGIIQALEEKSFSAHYVARELRLVVVGCERAGGRAAVADDLGAALWKRLAVESTLRLAWIAGDELTADAEGELILDEEEVQRRCHRLSARDVLNLAGAYKAVTEESGHTVDPALSEGLSRLAAGRAVSAAPDQLRQLAVNQTQKAIYAQHRLCSAVVHPGELVDDQKAWQLVSRMIDEVAVMAVVYGRALRNTLMGPSG